MTGWETGDAASVSALAADLVRAAAVIEEVRAGLVRVDAELACWSGSAAAAACESLHTAATAVRRAADGLETCARALQRYSVELAEARTLGARATQYCELHGLYLDPSGAVRLPWGAYPVTDASAFGVHLPEGQRLADTAGDAVRDACRRLRSDVAEAVASLRAVAAQ